LGGMGDDARAIISALTPLLKDEVDSVRKDTVHALENLGAGAKPAVPALLALLPDTDKRIELEVKAISKTKDGKHYLKYDELQSLRRATADALTKIDPATALNAGIK